MSLLGEFNVEDEETNELFNIICSVIPEEENAPSLRFSNIFYGITIIICETNFNKRPYTSNECSNCDNNRKSLDNIINKIIIAVVLLLLFPIV